VRISWFWQVVSAAASVMGRAATRMNLGANDRRSMWEAFAVAAADAVDITNPDKAHIRESEQWRACDDALFVAPANSAHNETTIADLHELPPHFQDAFEAAKATAELEYATRAERFPHHPHLAEFPIHQLKRIQDVFFAYCTNGRDACKQGNWTVAQMRQRTEAAFPVICDYYFGREHRHTSVAAKLDFRHAMWKTTADDQQWKHHVAELAAIAKASRAADGPPRSEPANDSVPTGEKVPRLPNKRLSASITSRVAANRMEAYIQSKQISQTEFATAADTTERTIRAFRRTGKVRRDIFGGIARAMGIGKDDLLRPE
jgi:hypothetical protein